MLKFDNVRDRLNFKMMCAYCHQIGTRGFRAPEQPVDWDTMIRRMDGFGGLYPHTKETIVQRIIDTYKDNAVNNWPPYEPPPAPTGMADEREDQRPGKWARCSRVRFTIWRSVPMMAWPTSFTSAASTPRPSIRRQPSEFTTGFRAARTVHIPSSRTMKDRCG